MSKHTFCSMCHHNFAAISGLCHSCHKSKAIQFATVLKESDIYGVIDRRGGEGVFVVFESNEESWEEDASRFEFIHDLICGLYYCRSRLDGRCVRIAESTNN